MQDATTPDPALREQEDKAMIEKAFQHLIDTYLASNHRRKVEVIAKAFNFARQAHKGVRRLSGEPYILHPIAVAQIVCEEIGLGSTSICAALLHDVEEDTDYTNEDLSNLFGAKVANIVEGLTKISGGIFGERASLQAETFKKLLLMMSDDIRVILIKIADRLHNMRTLSSMLPAKQYKIASETLYIFAPLADRLGLNKIKTELEDLSFRYEHPEAYADVVARLDETQSDRDDFFNSFTPAIKDALDRMGVEYSIKARVKSPYSIWTKMQNKHVPFEEVYDILAIRIVFTPKERSREIEECYRIYAALTQIYKPHPTRFRDWLSNPKANGYQALHNTFMSKQGKWIEVQIRSDRMDDIAEQGIAAHWKYKDPGSQYDETELDRWLNSIKEILDDPQPDTLDFLDTIKLNLFASEILVFTPKGDIRTMPVNSTALDFAFSVHSFLGSHCIGAKVNHRLVPLSYRLKSGDQIEVLTSRNQHVQADWLNYVTTAKAKGKIQAILRRQDREKQDEGEELLRQFLKSRDMEFTAQALEKLCTFHHYADAPEFYRAVADGIVTFGNADVAVLHGKNPSQSWRRFIPFVGRSSSAPAADKEKDDAGGFLRSINRKKILRIDEGNMGSCAVSDCCHPIPGDDVVGYISPANVLEIHKRSCPKAVELKTRFGNNIVALDWDMHCTAYFDARIYLKGIDSRGVLYDIADVLHRQLRCIVKRITLETENGIFEGSLEVGVHDLSDVKAVCEALAEVESVTKAVRVD